jgi:membrane protease YdiL (CAAX protease family)
VEVAAVLVLQLVLFQLAEEIGFTGFLQHYWQDRYDPMKLTVYLAFLWALWHLPDHFAEEGWGVEALISAPIIFATANDTRHQTDPRAPEARHRLTNAWSHHAMGLGCTSQCSRLGCTQRLPGTDRGRRTVRRHRAGRVSDQRR